MSDNYRRPALKGKIAQNSHFSKVRFGDCEDVRTVMPAGLTLQERTADVFYSTSVPARSPPVRNDSLCRPRSKRWKKKKQELN